VVIVLAVIVVAPFIPPLVNILLMAGTDRMPDEPRTPLAMWRYGPLAKALVLILCIGVHMSDGLATRRTYFGGGHGVYGMYNVDRFLRSGVEVVPLASDAKTWKRVATDGRYDSSAITVQFANGVVRQYQLTEDVAKREWTLRDQKRPAATLHYSLSADGTVLLDGQIDNDPVQLHLQPVDLQSLPLLRPMGK
jgi:hypothetical protein